VRVNSFIQARDDERSAGKNVRRKAAAGGRRLQPYRREIGPWPLLALTVSEFEGLMVTGL